MPLDVIEIVDEALAAVDVTDNGLAAAAAAAAAGVADDALSAIVGGAPHGLHLTDDDLAEIQYLA